MGGKELGIKGWLAGSAQKGTQQETGKALARAVSVHLDRHRIAVLPFANISPSPADEYFADGLTEELISVVSKIRGLKTISRTSVMSYKGTTKAVDEIARELNVGTVLEGSVRKAGNRLRINMQLIDVGKDEPLCSESYDRELEDVFAIQMEVAQNVADALKTLHETLAFTMLALVAVHAIAALKHHLLDRDDVLHRMLPLIRPRRDRTQ